MALPKNVFIQSYGNVEWLSMKNMGSYGWNLLLETEAFLSREEKNISRPGRSGP